MKIIVNLITVITVLGSGSIFAGTIATPQNQEPIIVIGAGMAGITAANKLNKANNVIVLEASDRIGGRVLTDTKLGTPIDLGGAWIHGIKGNPMYNFTKMHNIATTKTDYTNEILYDYNFKLMPENEYNKLNSNKEYFLEYFYKYKPQAPDSYSIYNFIQYFNKDRKLNNHQAKLLLQEMRVMYEHEYAGDLEQLSARYFDDDDELPGGDVIINNGYKQIINLLNKGLDIRLNSKVTKIDYSTNPIIVHTDKDKYVAKKVVITVPHAVLKNNAINFIPKLPENKIQAINNLGVGNFLKVAVLYPEVFWDKDIEFIRQLNPDWNMYINFSKIYKKPILIAIKTGTSAITAENLSANLLANQIHNNLEKIYGKNIPNFIKAIKTNWHSSEYSMGAYSFIAVGATNADYKVMAKPIANKLFFAGDATHTRFPSTIHGAYLSGLRAAREVNSSPPIF